MVAINQTSSTVVQPPESTRPATSETIATTGSTHAASLSPDTTNARIVREHINRLNGLEKLSRQNSDQASMMAESALRLAKNWKNGCQKNSSVVRHVGTTLSEIFRIKRTKDHSTRYPSVDDMLNPVVGCYELLTGHLKNTHSKFPKRAFGLFAEKLPEVLREIPTLPLDKRLALLSTANKFHQALCARSDLFRYEDILLLKVDLVKSLVDVSIELTKTKTKTDTNTDAKTNAKTEREFFYLILDIVRQNSLYIKWYAKPPEGKKVLKEFRAALEAEKRTFQGENAGGESMCDYNIKDMIAILTDIIDFPVVPGNNGLELDPAALPGTQVMHS